MMTPEFMRKLKRFGLVSFCVLILDIVSKQLALEMLFYPPQQIAVTSFFNLVPVWNSGISFGLFSDYPMVTTFAIPLLAVGVIGWLVSELRHSGLVAQIGSGLIAGGAIGNVVDRIRFSRVVDFLDFHFAGYHWPAFNIADSAIFIGVLCWLYAMITTQQ